MIYLQWLSLAVPFAILMARHSPVPVTVALWVAMLCWETYDMHPDHLVAYSILFGAAVLRRIQGDLPVATLLTTRTSR